MCIGGGATDEVGGGGGGAVVTTKHPLQYQVWVYCLSQTCYRKLSRCLVY